MKSLNLKILALSFSVILFSCKKEESKTVENVDNTEQTAPAETKTTTAAKEGNFDINSVPVSEAALGEFPYFPLPTNLKLQSKPMIRSYDVLFFPMNGVMTPIEGKVWKSYIVQEENTGESFSLPFFKKSYDDAITALGGKKIFDGKVSQEEMDRIKDEATYFGEEGSIDYWNESVRVYLIRRAAGDDVYVQLSGNSAGGQMQVLQKAVK